MRTDPTSEALDSIENDFANVELLTEKGGDIAGVDCFVLSWVTRPLRAQMCRSHASSGRRHAPSTSS